MQYSPGSPNTKRSKGETLTVETFWQRKMTEQVKANAKGETEFELLAPVRGRVIRVDGVNGYFTYEKGERRFHFKVTLSNCPAGASPDAAEESITAVFDMWDKAGATLLGVSAAMFYKDFEHKPEALQNFFANMDISREVQINCRCAFQVSAARESEDVMTATFVSFV